MKNKFDVITFGEAMVMFIAQDIGSLENIEFFVKKIAGAELNVATGLARLGVNVAWISRIGNDSFGKSILNHLRKEKINSDFISIDPALPTGFQLKSKVTDGSDPTVEYFRKNSAATKLTTEDIKTHIYTKYLHLTGIAPALSSSCFNVANSLIKIAKSQKSTIIFDPNIRFSLWNNIDEMKEKINSLAFQADIVLPGIKEGELLTGFTEEEKIADFYLSNGVKKVIIKLGKNGAYFKTSFNTKGYIPGYSVKNIVDTVGAGDAFAVGVISALLEEKSLEDAIKRANLFGALAIQHEGDNEGLITRDKLNKYNI
ncbi:sugar kinase [Avibacterium avium]|uniref:sugar kinase n=1 Tax=Avibacterium avium TaxID=751 RepID=UPI003BF89A1D